MPPVPDHPAVSVLIPSWNGGRYFPECLESALGQTLRDIEIIVADNASTDGSAAVADEFARRDGRVRVLHLDGNLGAGRARNAAMAMARGEYLAFLDSDDRYPAPHVLEMMLARARREGADICGGSLLKIDAASRVIDIRIPDQYFLAEGWVDYRDYQYEGGFYRFLYRRSFLRARGLSFPPYRRFQDALFCVRAMLAAGRFYAMPAFTYAYRKNHKVEVWTREKVRDHMLGLRGMIGLSREEGLDRLHYHMAKNLSDTVRYRMPWPAKYLFLSQVARAIAALDWDVVRRQNASNRVRVTPGKIWRGFFTSLR